MALKVFDGFEKYAGAADFLTRSNNFLQWQFPVGAPGTFSIITGLEGIGKALQWGDTAINPIRSVWGARNAEAYFAARLLIPLNTSFEVVLQDTVAGNPQITIYFNRTNYTIQVFRGTTGGTSLLLTANNIWAGATVQFFEFHYKIASSGGIVQIKLNNVEIVNVTGANTQNTANAYSDAVDWAPDPTGLGHGVTTTIDDLRYNDTTSDSGASANNTWMGDQSVRTANATGNDAVQWTPLSGANWQNVASATFDGDTAYNYSSTATQQDTYDFGALQNTITTIAAVQLTYAARKDDAGSRSVKSVVKISGTSYFGSTYSMASTYAYFTDLWVINPATSLNWTLSDVNGAAYGINEVS